MIGLKSYSQRRKERTMPPLFLGYVLKSPLPVINEFISVSFETTTLHSLIAPLIPVF